MRKDAIGVEALNRIAKDADWTAPPTELPNTTGGAAWKIDYDRRDQESGVRIYSLETSGPKKTLSLRCVAKDVRRDEAELIVALYNSRRVFE